MRTIEIEPGLFSIWLSEEEKEEGRRRVEKIIKEKGGVILNELLKEKARGMLVFSKERRGV